MPVIIPPSPRPLLLWLATAAVCTVMLGLEGVTLLTLWRRPARAWRLGLVALMGAALGALLTGHILSAYTQLSYVGVCYQHGCEEFFPLLTHAIAVSLLLGGLLAALTAASLVAALALSAMDGATRQAPTATVGSLLARFATLVCWSLLADVGFYWTVDGVYIWIGGAFFTNPASIGDGLGLIPLYLGVFEAIGGVILLTLGAWLLWSVVSRPAPQQLAAAAEV